MAADIQKPHLLITGSGAKDTLENFCLYCKAIFNGVFKKSEKCMRV